MTLADATQAARDRSRHEVISVYYDPDWPVLDWSDRYVARRYLNRPAHGTLIASYFAGGLYVPQAAEADRPDLRPGWIDNTANQVTDDDRRLADRLASEYAAWVALFGEVLP